MPDRLPEPLLDAVEHLHRRASEFVELLERIEPAAGEVHRPFRIERGHIDDLVGLDGALRAVEPQAGMLPDLARWGLRDFRARLDAIADRWGCRAALGPDGLAHVESLQASFREAAERPYVEALLAHLEHAERAGLRPPGGILKSATWARDRAREGGYTGRPTFDEAKATLPDLDARHARGPFGTVLIVATDDDALGMHKALKDVWDGIASDRFALQIERCDRQQIARLARQPKTPPNEASTGDGGDGERHAEAAEHQRRGGASRPRPKRGGRPVVYDPKRDKRIFEAWATGEYASRADLARAFEMTERDAFLAYDRYRNKLKRMAK
jgi:hypothetical protein